MDFPNEDQEMKSPILEQDEQDLQKLYHNMTGLISKLPMDIIIDILTRLPIKTLSPCRWVCKSWYNLIHHPRFTLIQHAKAIHNNTLSLIHCDSIGHHYMLDYDSLVFPQPLTPSYQVLTQKRFYEVVGSCNGLLCLRSSPYCICNPITGDGIRLPLFPNYDFIDDFVSGFGFDSVTNQYKVVRVIENKQKLFEAQVCTVGSGCSWREIPIVPYSFKGNALSLVTNNVFVFGALHWFGYKKLEQNNDSMVIVTFDVSSEEFGEILLPSNLQLRNECRCYLGVLGKSFGFVHGFGCSYHVHTEVWLMKEYGVQVSWTKLCVIRDELAVLSRGMVYDFVKFLENEEMLLLYNNASLGYYNYKEGTFRPLSIQMICGLSSYLFPIPHVESLISPRDIARLKKSQ